MAARESQPRRRLPTSPFLQPDPEPLVAEVYTPQDRISHDRYGLGTVISVEENSVVVDFGAETRRISIPSPKLTRL